MKSLQIKNLAYVSVTLVLGTVWLLAYFSERDLSRLGDYVTLIPQAVTIQMAMFAIFTTWCWKWKIFRGWLVPFPNLNGTWVGEIHSSWIDPETEEKIAPIPTMLTIKQSLLNISCVMHTGEMKSSSILEEFRIDDDRQTKTLSYVYSSKPRSSVRHRSPQHDGTAVLEVIPSPNGMKLIGEYWTGRGTSGEIHLTHHSKTLLQELPENLASHPLSSA